MKKIKGGITAPEGYLSSGVTCGLKKSGNKDLALIYSESPAAAAGVFTSNEVKAAPVLLSQQRLRQGKARAIVINSGNANACTGEQGFEDAVHMTEVTGKELGIDCEEILNASTGIIGEPLPMEKIEAGIPGLVSELGPDGQDAVEAIMTTDTFPKQVAFSCELPQQGCTVKIGGMAKGSGMIHPDMATMLGFLTTDLVIEPGLLKEALQSVVDVSFNRISVDGDQSTNDCVFLLANSEAGNELLQEKNEDYEAFVATLRKAAVFLARAIVTDGEGATKFITIKVKKAVSDQQADTVARQVANSSLVKTACFGSDPNWGRILAAAGAGGTGIDPEKTEVSINGQKLFARGLPAESSRDDLAGLMDEEEIEIEIILNQGDSSLEFWTSDLSYKYVEINAEYHT
ncbi:MAG: bifunctional glutamate N-acetyltransferase/amino-acid acetyltransferase ArgJ [Bacillota bacterium]